MGRSYYVDETVENYLINLVQEKNSIVTGLLIGQISLQRDYIVRAVKTPEKEPEKKADLSKLEDIDEEWFLIHANQVSRMLPGGLVLAGVFLISSPDLSKESTNVLKKLIFATEKFEMKTRWWSSNDEEVTDRAAVHICSKTKKIICRTFDVKDPKSTAKPADWKYQRTPLSWCTVDCNINVDLTVPLSSSTYQDWQKCTRNRLAEWAKEIEDYTILFSGQLKDKDDDLVEDQKKHRSVGHSSLHIVSATVLSPSNTSNHSTARVQVCNSSLNIQGIVKCRGFICNNKPKVKEAIQVIKRDILNTLSYRCEILFEDIIFNGPQHESEKSMCPLPQRVFFHVPGSSLMLCDYVFGDETKEDLQSRFLEMLDQKVHYEDLVFTEEKNVTSRVNDVCESHQLSSGQECAPKNNNPPSEVHQSKSQSMSFVIAITVALLAALISYIYLNKD